MAAAFARCVLLPLAAVTLMTCSSGEQPSAASASATLLLLNARIWTADESRPLAEALAVRGDEITAVGANEQVERLAGEGARIIDAGGRFVVPGFIDCHVHLLEGGFRLSAVQLRDARTPEELVARIGAFADLSAPGSWITGGDWDHELWGGDLPHRAWVDSATPENPVWIHRLDGHMALANSRALEIAGVTRETADVPGGTIVRDRSGEPTGLLKDNAMALVDRAVQEPTEVQQDRALQAAMDHVARHGVTSVHHMGSWSDLEVFERAHRAGRLRTRIYAAVPLETWERLAEAVGSQRYGGRDGRGDDWLRIGALKGFVDGSLGSHTAAFHEPFTDVPNDRGLLVNRPEDLAAWISGADAAGLHVLVHAIGDRANGLLLDLYEQTAGANGLRDRRFRIEHAQHLAPQDIRRFAPLGVIASMQPYHAIDDGRWAERVIGARRSRTTYAFRSLLDAAATVAFGSDWFVAPPTPLEGIYAAVTRRTLDGRHPDGWVPEQKISVEEALYAYTRAAARASFEEGRKGMLREGMLADFVILESDLREVPPEEIRNVGVVMTVAGGDVVYHRDG